MRYNQSIKHGFLADVLELTKYRREKNVDEKEFKAFFNQKDLDQKSLTISFEICDFNVLQRLDHYSTTLDKTWEELINAAIIKLIGDISYVHGLRH